MIAHSLRRSHELRTRVLSGRTARIADAARRILPEQLRLVIALIDRQAMGLARGLPDPIVAISIRQHLPRLHRLDRSLPVQPSDRQELLR